MLRGKLVLHVLANSACRERRAADSPHQQTSPRKPAPLPELRQGHASPATAHLHESQHASRQPPHPAAAGHNSQHDCMQQQAGDSRSALQAEPTFSYMQEQPVSAAHCLRCGVKQSQKMHDCRFHPALLRHPGPFLYSPEWHACRAAKDARGDPGCYVRHGHYFPGQAVQGTGLVDARAGKCTGSPSHSRAQPQPRTQLPFPLCRP